MQIQSRLLCRANKKIYELLEFSNEKNDYSLTPLLDIDGNGPALPLRLIALPGTSSGSDRWVAVYPDLPISSASYMLGVCDKHDHIVQSRLIKVHFAQAKWQSRINYRLNSPECAEIRCIDERTPRFGDTNFNVLTAISTTTHILLRVKFSAPAVYKDNMIVICLNERLELVSSDFQVLHSAIKPSPVKGGPDLYEVTFSIKIPYNQQDVFFCFIDKATKRIISTRRFTKPECDSLLEYMGRLLYSNAGVDPYYSEWFNLHRASQYELELQREQQIPSGPSFSIVVPLYKTPVSVFREMIESVIDQTYAKWELILVNASPDSHDLSAEIQRYCQHDDRITLITLESNQGISENTNAGIAVASGDFISFFDHDDLLEPNALFEYAKAIQDDPRIDVLYCDEDKIMPDGTLSQAFFKPDFSIDMLRDKNYICHMLTMRKTLLEQLEPNTSEFDGAQDHNLTLEAAEKTQHIHHIPKILYHFRVTPQSTASNVTAKPYALQSGLRAVSNHLKRMGTSATVTADNGSSYKIVYDIPKEKPLVSIVIPTKDNAPILERCISSIIEKSTYHNLEIILVDNGSTEQATAELYERLLQKHHGLIRIISWPDAFNFSAMVNFGAASSKGDYLLLLNNDTEVITPNWIELMLGNCSRSDVGAVGAKLLFPDNTIQHVGINITGEPGHLFAHLPNDAGSYFELHNCQRNLSAVTAACMMTKRDAFELVGGFDELLAVAYNDVDYCLKLQEHGLLIVYCPLVELYHYESLSRGFDEDTEGKARFIKEKATLISRWPKKFAQCDPYYTPNLRPSLPEACYYSF